MGGGATEPAPRGAEIAPGGDALGMEWRRGRRATARRSGFAPDAPPRDASAVGLERCCGRSVRCCARVGAVLRSVGTPLRSRWDGAHEAPSHLARVHGRSRAQRRPMLVSARSGGYSSSTFATELVASWA